MEFDLKNYNAHIESLRQREYPSLLGTTYLDHAGTTLYAKSLIDAFHQDLTSNLYGNPHSASPASHLATHRVDAARLKVLEYFNADPNHFDVIFTANATASIKLVADCFRDQGFWYGYHRDAHSSIVGVREIASLGSQCFVSDEEVEDWIDKSAAGTTKPGLNLFAYPAQSNMTGHRTPLSWAARIRNTSQNKSDTPYILLDAASYLTSGRLNLCDSDAAPDFITLSFYKIFGFPDLGALLVRKTASEVMTHRRYFGGGTVDQITVIDRSFHAVKRQTLHDFLEDGTLPFHNIVALEYAIAVHKHNFGSAANISKHTVNLANRLYTFMSSCRHANGTPVVEVHKDKNSSYNNSTTQGPIIAFSIRKGDGTYVGKSHFEKLAIECGFQLRTGGVCNPGGIATMLNLNHWELRRNFTEGVRCGDDVDVVGGKPTGIIRVSLGPMSTMSDILRFISFIEYFFVNKAASRISTADNNAQSCQIPASGITPMEGGNRVILKDVDNAAYQVWNAQWCVVELNSYKVITQCDDLVIDIDLESEELVIGHRHNQDELRISLWSIPAEQAESKQMNGRTFDLYNEPHIAGWLGQHTGILCTLARYRQEDIRKQPEMTTCVIGNCTLRCAGVDLLRKHYRSHAEEFLVQHPFDSKMPPKSSIWRAILKKKSVEPSLSESTSRKRLSLAQSIISGQADDHSTVSKVTRNDKASNKNVGKIFQAKMYSIHLQSAARPEGSEKSARSRVRTPKNSIG